MLHEIEPAIFDNQYKQIEPKVGDIRFVFQEERVGVSDIQSRSFTRIQQLHADLRYVFSIEDTAFFLDLTACNDVGLQWVDIHQFRTWQPQSDAFAMMVAYQLHRWYQSHRFCGVCGNPTMHHAKERACVCTVCQHIVYPTIAPAIIVGIIDGERLLLTKYAKGMYQKYALVAGFMEIGETLEACVKREVKEEVGLDVEDIVYYKSQPWPLSSTILVGFFAHVCGSHQVTIDQEELSEATWFHREDIVPPDSLRSLTAEMMEAFRTGIHRTQKIKK